MLLFSLPVHEQPDVVLNQIQNFKFYNPESIIVLHVSAWMPEVDYRQLRNHVGPLDDVYINDKRLWSGHADGTQLKMHVINILYARKLGLHYDFICFHASNDMFVRSNLKSFISEMCGSAANQLKSYSEWPFTKACLNDKKLQELMGRNNLSLFHMQQIEGSFYKRRIIETIVDRILEAGLDEITGLYSHGMKRLSTRFVNWTNQIINKKVITFCKQRMTLLPEWLELGYGFYPKEEAYFPTLSQDLIHRKGSPYCYINWEAELVITKEDIDNIRSNKWEKNYFAIKRVDRKIDDPLRQYISNLPLE